MLSWLLPSAKSVPYAFYEDPTMATQGVKSRYGDQLEITLEGLCYDLDNMLYNKTFSNIKIQVFLF